MAFEMEGVERGIAAELAPCPKGGEFLWAVW